MRTRLLSLLAITLTFTLVAAACGDDSDDTGDGDGETTTAAPDDSDGDGETTTAAPDEGDGDGDGETTTAAPDEGDDAAAAISEERCQANRDAGTVTFVTGFDFAAAAGIIDIIVADAEGFFEEVCIDVEIQPGFAPSNGALVIEGQAQMGMAGSFAELVANNVAGEGDLVALLHWGRTAIEAMVIPEGVAVADFSELCGTLVGIKGDLPYSLQASVALAGIERSCFDEILLDGFDPVQHLELGVDALPVYKSNEPNTLDAQGIVYTTLDPLEFDVPSSFGVTFTTQSFIDDNPDLVEDVVRALVKGQEAAAADHEAAVDHAFELIDAAGNPAFLAKEAELFRWEIESGLIASLAPAGVGVGIPDPARFGEEIDAMVAAGVFETAPDWESMVDETIAAGVYDGTALLWPTS